MSLSRTAKVAFAAGKAAARTTTVVSTAGKYTSSVLAAEQQYNASLPGLVDMFVYSPQERAVQSAWRVAATVAEDMLGRRRGAIPAASRASRWPTGRVLGNRGPLIKTTKLTLVRETPKRRRTIGRHRKVA